MCWFKIKLNVLFLNGKFLFLVCLIILILSGFKCFLVIGMLGFYFFVVYIMWGKGCNKDKNFFFFVFIFKVILEFWIRWKVLFLYDYESMLLFIWLVWVIIEKFYLVKLIFVLFIVFKKCLFVIILNFFFL